MFSAAKAPIVWEEQVVGTTVDARTNSMVSRENLDSVLVSKAPSAAPSLSALCTLNLLCMLRAPLLASQHCLLSSLLAQGQQCP